jgi:hypothetical protein
MVELKVMLVLAARRFEFKEAYEELYIRERKKGMIPPEIEWAGGKAYMIAEAGNKPKDGIPMWVKEIGH